MAATALFAVGVAIERSSGTAEHREAAATPGEAHEESGGERAGEGESSESADTSGLAATEPRGESELRPLGIDVEAWPFVGLAAVVSLALAFPTWLRPHAAWLLWLLAIAMLAFAVLDVREVLHQLDADENGLAVLAGVVAALHGAAAVLAATIATGPREANTRKQLGAAS